MRTLILAAGMALALAPQSVWASPDVDRCTREARAASAEAREGGLEPFLKDSQIGPFCECVVERLGGPQGEGPSSAQAAQLSRIRVSAACLYAQLKKNPPRWASSLREQALEACRRGFDSPSAGPVPLPEAVARTCDCNLRAMERRYSFEELTKATEAWLEEAQRGEAAASAPPGADMSACAPLSFG